jgi:hypothetical protein
MRREYGIQANARPVFHFRIGAEHQYADLAVNAPRAPDLAAWRVSKAQVATQGNIVLESY